MVKILSSQSAADLRTSSSQPLADCELLTPKTYDERLNELQTTCVNLPSFFVQVTAEILIYGKPTPFSEESWQNVILKMLYLVQEQALVADVLKDGWEIKDFFGCHPMRPIEHIESLGYAVSPYKDKIVSCADKVLRAELYTKGHITYVSHRSYEELVLVTELMDKKADLAPYRAPTDHIKKTITDYLGHHKGSPAWGYRTIEKLSHYLKNRTGHSLFLCALHVGARRDKAGIRRRTGSYVIKCLKNISIFGIIEKVKSVGGRLTKI